MKHLASLLAQCLIGGFALMAGMRAGEWLIPKPEARVVFCVYTADDTDEEKPATCRTLEQWIGEARK